jgi:hypothetical protein
MRDWARDLACRRSYTRDAEDSASIFRVLFPLCICTKFSVILLLQQPACSAGHSPEEVTPVVVWTVSAQCKLVDRIRKPTDGTTFHCSDRDYSGAVTRESIRRPNTALHKYVIDRTGSLGCPTEPPHAYYDARTENSNSDLRGCLSGLCSSGSRNEHNVDAPRAKQNKDRQHRGNLPLEHVFSAARSQARNWSK